MKHNFPKNYHFIDNFKEKAACAVFSLPTCHGSIQDFTEINKILKDLIKKLNLDVELINQNILEQPKKFSEGIFVARAFKPLKIILQLIHNNAENWKKIFIFLGKTGKNELLQASKIWDIEYKQRMSVTSDDSIVIEINRLKKK